MKTQHVTRLGALLLLIALPLSVFAQSAKPAAQLAYADNESALELIDVQGIIRQAFIGDQILAGETIKTKDTTAELKLLPNGSIIKLSRNTSFKVEAFAEDTGKGTNIFSLMSGKIRAIAAKTGGKERYQIKTPTAVCGIRGTDFSLAVEAGKRDAVFVKRGLVEFSRILADKTLQTIMVGGGQFADTYAPAFSPAQFTEEQLRKEYGDLDFAKLDPALVSQGDAPAAQPPAPTTPPATPEVAAVAPAPATTTDGTPATGQPATPGTTPQATPATPPEVSNVAPPVIAADGTIAKPKDDPKKRTPSATEVKIFNWLGDVLGFEVGSMSINGKTYGKAVIQPDFQIGRLKMGLYLPVIYTSNLFDPADWYHPAGNNEWSFGTEYWGGDNLAGAWDLASDILLKIRYVEYGDRYVDPFYFNAGNLNSMTIGHGAIMRNFANDSDFPAIRRIGINTGVDFKKFGFEAVVNDLTEPEIFGARIKLFNIFGISAIADIDPLGAGGKLTDAQQQSAGDPILLGTGLDLDIPIVKLDIFHLRAFADIATVLPYTQYDIAGGPAAGLQWQMFYDTSKGTSLDALRNYGVMAGFLGRVLFIDWRLEYRNYRGVYRPTFFDATYERNRLTYAAEYANLLINPASDNSTTMNGIYGEASFNLFRDKIEFTAGYMMPWTWSGSVPWSEVMKDDYIKGSLVIKKGLIPVVDISGAISYERTGFVSAIAANNFTLLDSTTVFKGEIAYPVTPNMDLAFIVGTVARRDVNGNVVYNGNEVVMDATLTLETRISF